MILIWQVLVGMSKARLLKKKKQACVKRNIIYHSSLGRSNQLPYMLQAKKFIFHKLF